MPVNMGQKLPGMVDRAVQKDLIQDGGHDKPGTTKNKLSLELINGFN